MKANNVTKRLLSVFLVLCMVAAWVLPAGAYESGISFTQVSNDRVSANLFGKDPVQLEEEPQYADDDVVRVSIFVDRAGVIDAGFAVQGLAVNEAAMAYRQQLQVHQTSVVNRIENAIKEKLDVVWNLTLATNLISANVKYGQIADIEKVSGVSEVVIETVYTPDVVSSGAADPNMATSSAQTGTLPSYMAGYTGAGSKVAIIDTGLDIQHLSFDASAYEYSLSLLAEEAGMSVEEYTASLDLMDAEHIASVLSQLNVSGRAKVSAEDLYISSKIPFGFNYVDKNLNVEHLSDAQGEHGSHVAGISTANAYVPNGDGTFAKAVEEVFVQGVAPDAQVIVMKVFGAAGGAYDTDYMAAIEDAIVLGADSVNLSLGSGNPGMSRNSNAKFQAILESLEKSGVVVSMSAGNSGAWMDSAENGVPYLYLDDVSMQTNGSPGSFTNSLSVASVDNAGFVSPYVSVISVNGKNIAYYDSNDYGTSYGNLPFATLKGQHEFVFLNGVGKPEEFAALGEDALKGKIALCYRGETSFFEKCNAAVEAGAIGVIVVNNVDELFGMNLTGYKYQAPAVSISLSQGEAFKMDPILGEDDVVLGWTGTMEVPSEPFAGMHDSKYYTMSSFSSWGVPGSLELKPEITAPGGNILSVNGANKAYSNFAHDQYEVMSGTSMAAPQVAGMAALLAQYIRENNLTEKTGLDARTLAQSLLMSTSVPVMEGENGGYYYSILKQGSGLANVGAAVMADSYIMMNPDATNSWADGKVKVELGDDPAKEGIYTFSFTINNLTDSAKTYALSADFFTQGAFSDGRALYLDTWTTALQPIVVFTADGQQLKALDPALDFNGDQVVDFVDGYFLLEAVLSGAEVPASADMDGNEVVTSYDALLFFQELGTSSATVPANGSTTVEVTVTLSERDRAWLANYENGAYLEGFVYAETLATEEGVEGTTHSIPVLGFYGNWSDASMFDKGSYEEYILSGEETRAPYLYTTNFAKGNVNSLYVSYADDPANVYYFGGNPIVEDEIYMPERNAISGVNGDMISKIGFANIRNAAASFFQVLDLTNQQVLINQSVGAISSAYFHVNSQVWKNTYWTLSTNLSLNGVADNTLVDVGVCLVPEYYVDAEGNVNWAALGNGTTFSMAMTVDNTAPTVENVVVDEDSNTMAVTATDNQYIAAVVLLDIYGEHVYTMVGSNADAQAGVAGEFALDLTDVGGPSFLVQVYDYAMNCATYEINQQIGEVVDEVESITISETSAMMAKGTTKQLSAIVRPFNASDRGVVWTTSNEAVATVENGKVVAVGAGNAVITATSALDESFSASCEITVVELNTTLKGVLQDVEGNPMLFSWDLANDTTWTAGAPVALPMNNLAYDAYGDALYGQSVQDDHMYGIDPVTGEMTKLSSAACEFGIAVSDMAVSPVYATATEPLLVGVYGYYFLTHNTPSQNTFSSGFNFQSYLASKTGATKFVAICDYGAAVVSGAYWDVYLALDDANCIWLLQTNGSSARMGVYATDLNLTYPTSGDSQYCSLISDSVGDLYLAYFTGSTSEIYYLTFNGSEFSSMYVGNVGADVWPVALYAAEANVPAEPAEPASVSGTIEEMIASAQMLDVTVEAQSVNISDLVVAEEPMSGAILDTEKNTVTVSVTAKDVNGENVESNNGVITIHYDPTAQTLRNVVVHADFYVVDQTANSVTFAYVNLNKFAPSDLVATLVFDVVNEDAAGATIEYKEVNQSYDLQTEVEMESSTLMQALADLEQAIADGDKNLSDKIDNVTAALNAAIQAGDANLTAQISSVNNALRSLISQVSTNLEQAKTDLAAAITNGDKALEDKITALSTALETAVATSEALRVELNNSLTEAVATLNTTIETAVETLTAAVEQVASDLAATKEELNASVDEAVANLMQADQGLTAAIEQVLADLAAAKEEMNASIDEAAANLAAAKTELAEAITNGDKALDDKIAGLTTALEAAVAAAEAADEALRTELNARIDEAVAALNATIAQVQKDLEDAKAELAAKDAQLNNLVIVAIVIASISACGCLALLALILLKKRS